MPSRMKQGYVMMLDVLGYREYISKEKGSDFFKIWESIKKGILEKKVSLEQMFLHKIEIDFLCFSDTLVVCISLAEDLGGLDIDPRGTILIFPYLITTFFIPQMQNNIFFRGAISYGEFQLSTEDNIIMGSALDEASDWYEATDWIGIILTPSAGYALDLLYAREGRGVGRSELLRTTYRKYHNIPFKTGIPHACNYAVCWWDTELSMKDPKSFEIIVLDMFSRIKHLKSYAAKYRNTVDFVRYILFG